MTSKGYIIGEKIKKNDENGSQGITVIFFPMKKLDGDDLAKVSPCGPPRILPRGDSSDPTRLLEEARKRS
jgi:hypothetical protein